MIMKWKQLFTPAENLEASQLETFMAQQPAGSYTLLDVRQPVEYEQSHIPGSLLIPLPVLTDRIRELDPEKPTIVY
jgi:rhodanese-related sulfurtransferase